jgi:lysophospholipase L1-like esterase
MVQRRIRRTVLGAVLAAVAVVSGSVAGPAHAASTPTKYYLALGDSVAFGYAPPQVTPPQWYQNAHNFKGYPEYLAPWFGLRDVNASCPGETSSSLIDETAQSNGCENSIGSDLGYRDAYPLHVSYAGNQLDYAKAFLGKHVAATKLITINVGANDLFVCQATTSDQCTGADFPATLNTIGQNLATILHAIRAAGYHNKLVVLAYYSISYTDPIQVAGTQLLNQTLSSVAQQYHGIVANGYAAFKSASGPAGDPCAAGLLIPLPGGGCNIHPSALGHIILANTIAKAAGAPSPIG